MNVLKINQFKTVHYYRPPTKLREGNVYTPACRTTDIAFAPSGNSSNFCQKRCLSVISACNFKMGVYENFFIYILKCARKSVIFRIIFLVNNKRQGDSIELRHFEISYYLWYISLIKIYLFILMHF